LELRLRWFGPHILVGVHVPPDHAARAHERLAVVFAPKLA
jgi:hypothetical protein